MRTPGLTKILLPVVPSDKRVNARDQYLALIDGQFYAGQFSKQWYGWNLGVKYDAGFQMDWDDLEGLWRISRRRSRRKSK